MTTAKAYIGICVGYFVAVGLSGCALIQKPTKVNLFQSYPAGPVVSTFECNLFDPEFEAAKDMCVMPSELETYDTQPPNCEAYSNCKKAKETELNSGASEERKAAVLDECMRSMTLDCETRSYCEYCKDAGMHHDCMRPKALDCALGCVSSTQQAYGKFLRCGEKAQLLAGFAIATLGASSAAIAAAGLSTFAAAALGGAAGAGLGYDYVFYNKARRGAYANGTVQLQCIASDTHSVAARTSQFTSSKLDKQASDYVQAQAAMVSDYEAALAMEGDLKKSALYDACKDKELLKPGIDMMAELTAEYTQIEASSSLVAAQIKIGLKVQNQVDTRLDLLGTDIVSAVDTIDVRAFAAAQAGVPDADQLAKALQAATSGFTKSASPEPTAKEFSFQGFQMKGTDCAIFVAPVNQFEVQIAKTEGKIKQVSNSDTNKFNSDVVQLNASVAALKLPDSSFSNCLSIQPPSTDKPSPSVTKQSSPAPSGAPSTGATPATGQPNDGGENASPDQAAKSPAPANGSTSPSKGSSLVFTVSPSGIVSADAGTGTATIKMMGGSSPYFLEPVDADQIEAVSADSNSVAVQLLGGSTSGRVLFADSAGASALVTVKKVSASKNPGGGTTPGNPAGGAVVNNICVGSGGRCGGTPASNGAPAPVVPPPPNDAPATRSGPNGAPPNGRAAPAHAGN